MQLNGQSSYCNHIWIKLQKNSLKLYIAAELLSIYTLCNTSWDFWMGRLYHILLCRCTGRRLQVTLCICLETIIISYTNTWFCWKTVKISSFNLAHSLSDCRLVYSWLREALKYFNLHKWRCKGQHFGYIYKTLLGEYMGQWAHPV